MALKPLSRSVSIIGVGATQFGTPFDTPELKDLSFQDMGAWAVLDAFQDAGVNPREVDHLIFGSTSSPLNNSMNIGIQESVRLSCQPWHKWRGYLLCPLGRLHLLPRGHGRSRIYAQSRYHAG